MSPENYQRSAWSQGQSQYKCKSHLISASQTSQIEKFVNHDQDLSQMGIGRQ